MGFYLTVSKYYDNLTDLHHDLVKPQDRVERRLYGGNDRQRED